MAGFVKRDKHPRDDFAQAPVLSVWKDGGVESGLDWTLIVVMVRRIGIDGDIEEKVGGGFVVFDDPSSLAVGINTEVDLAALSEWNEGRRVDGRRRHDKRLDEEETRNADW